MPLARSSITHLRCYHVYACFECDYRTEADVGEPDPAGCEQCGTSPLERLEPLQRMSYVRVTVTQTSPASPSPIEGDAHSPETR